MREFTFAMNSETRIKVDRNTLIEQMGSINSK